jgi:hypothetical protein
MPCNAPNLKNPIPEKGMGRLHESYNIGFEDTPRKRQLLTVFENGVYFARGEAVW